MENCPLCGNKASIIPPEWSGGRIQIKCAWCGEFSTNKITINELDALRAEGSSRIKELQQSIAEHPWYITKSQRLGNIVLESGSPRQMTKLEKKHRRRMSEKGSSINIGRIYRSDNDPNDT